MWFPLSRAVAARPPITDAQATPRAGLTPSAPLTEPPSRAPGVRPATVRGPQALARPVHHAGAVAAVLVILAGVAVGGFDADHREAGAVVVHEHGFDATVNGWSSWYGSYGLGSLGWGWCVDHGAHAPDADFGYVPATLDGEADADTQAAMAWAATMNDPNDAVTAAATMLVLHDLRHASYPYGVIDVDHMTTANLANFHGHENDILIRARAIKADALAHAWLRAPFTLTVVAPSTAPLANGLATVTLLDAAGRPVSGITVTVSIAGASARGPLVHTTGASGVFHLEFVASAGTNSFAASASVPDPRPRLFGSSSVVAQRIIQPATLTVNAVAAFTPVVTTTTSTTTRPTTTRPTTTTTTRPTTTTSTSTTTTRPSTTSTTTRPTTTRPPGTSTTSTTRPSTTTTRPPTTSTRPPTTRRPTTTTTSTSTTTTPGVTTTVTPPATPGPPASPPATPVAPPATPYPRGTLPVTGSRTVSWLLIGAGLVGLGLLLVAVGRDRRTR